MDTQRFDLPVAATIRIQSRSGKVEIIAEPRDDVLVEGERFDAREADGATLELRSGRGGSKTITVHCPVGTDLTVGTHSGSISSAGEVGAISSTTMSGHIDIDRADEADLRTGSGNISIGSVRGRCRLNTMSGKIDGGDLAACACGTMSGAIRIDHVAGPFKARTVSGSIRATCGGEGPIIVKSVSGKVEITLPEGLGVDRRFKTISGRVRCPFPEGDDCRIEAMTVSGAIDLVPA